MTTVVKRGSRTSARRVAAAMSKTGKPPSATSFTAAAPALPTPRARFASAKALLTPFRLDIQKAVEAAATLLRLAPHKNGAKASAGDALNGGSDQFGKDQPADYWRAAERDGLRPNSQRNLRADQRW